MMQGTGEIHGEHEPDPKGTEKVCQRGRFRKVIFQKLLGGFMYIYIVDTENIQADRSQETCKFTHTGRIVFQATAFKEQASTGIPAFNRPIGVIPAVDHAQCIFR